MKKSILLLTALTSVLLLSGCQMTSESLDAKKLITNQVDFCQKGLQSMRLIQSDDKEITEFTCN